MQVHSESEFLEKLGCGDVAGVKVLSIFGNTGDGKSHTLNHILFGGEKVFYTSKSPSSCTVGVWAAYEPQLGLIALDTEGLLGAASNQNQRMRLLLKVAQCSFLLTLHLNVVTLLLSVKIFLFIKLIVNFPLQSIWIFHHLRCFSVTCLTVFLQILQVLAVSDIVIYRTRAERLHNDMYMFLSSASGAYLKHFSPELRALSSRCGLDVPLSSLGPAVIIFQETTHTQLLGQGRRRKDVLHVFRLILIGTDYIYVTLLPTCVHRTVQTMYSLLCFHNLYIHAGCAAHCFDIIPKLRTSHIIPFMIFQYRENIVSIFMTTLASCSYVNSKQWFVFLLSSLRRSGCGRQRRHTAAKAFSRLESEDGGLQLCAVRRDPDHHTSNGLRGAAGRGEAASEEHSHTLPSPAWDSVSSSESKCWLNST